MYFNFNGTKIVVIIKQIMLVVGIVIGALTIIDGFFAIPYMELMIKIAACIEAVGIFLIGKLGPDLNNGVGSDIIYEEVVQVVDKIGETADICDTEE